MNKNKKIGFLLEFFPPNKLSSATLPFDIFNEFRKQNYDLTVLTGYERNNQLDNVIISESKSLIKIMRLKYYRSKKNKVLKLFSMLSFLFSALLKIHHFKNHDYILVFSNPPMNSLIGLVIRKIYKTKLIFIVYDIYPDIDFISNKNHRLNLLHYSFNFLNKKVYNGKHKIVLLSEDMRKFILKRFPHSNHSIYVIPNWFEDFSNIIAPKTINHNHIQIGFFGNLGVTQNFPALRDILLRSIEYHKIFFSFAVHGTYVNELRKLIINHDINRASVLPYLDERAYLQSLNDQDFIVVTLSRGIQNVASPSRVYSFMMSGKPIILLQHGKSALSDEIIHNNLGMFIDLDQPDYLDKFFNFIMFKHQSYFHATQDHFKNFYTKSINVKKYLDLL
jgi:glycosyltransferase involved in cell wall biosynthesis